MKIRKAFENEVQILTDISVRAFHSDVLVGGDPDDGPPDYDSVSWHEQMQREDHLYSYLDEQEHIVGGAVLFPSGIHLYIGRIFIDPTHFRKGYGCSLMEGIESVFPKAYVMELDTPICNIRTNAFYQKLGYKETGRDEDIVSYRKELVPVVEIHDDQYQGITTKYRDASRAIIVDSGNILLTDEVNVDQWMIPGGGIEGEETPTECCEREILEETGLVIRCGKCVAILNEFCGEYNFVNYYFEAFPTGEKKDRHPTEREKEAGSRPEWLPLQEAVDLFSRYADYHDDGSNPYVMRQGMYKREYHALLTYISTQKFSE